MHQLRNLKLMQHNITSIRPLETRKILKHFLSTNHIDIAILQEIWIKSNEEYKFPNYKFIKSLRPNGYGGVGLLIKNELQYEEVRLPKIEPIEAVAIKTLNTIPELIIISIYIPPLPIRNQDIKEPLKKIFDFIELQKISTILAGDFNAHSKIWNQNQNDCPRGELLLNLIEMTDLVILNDDSPTLIKSPNTTPSTIDLTLVTPEIACKIDWNVIDDEITSNHKIIMFEINNTAKQYLINRKYINKKKAIEGINNIEITEIKDQYDLIPKIQEQIEKAKYTPKNLNCKAKVWWNNKIDNLHKIKNKHLIEYFRNQTHDNLMKFKKSKAKLKQEIRKESKKSWNDLIETINPEMDQKTLWNTVRRISGGFPSKNNIHLLNDGKLADTFMNLNFPEILTDLKYTPKQTNEKITIEYIQVHKLIHSKKDTSSPGLDEISFQILKNTNIKLLIKIVEILNKVVNTGDLPEEWRDIKVIPILKPSKNSNNANSYRPLSMLCVLLKIINFVIKVQLNTYIETNNIFSIYSFGFKKKVSTINCINTLVSHVHEAKRESEIVLATFLDMTKAFDNVNVDTLINILENIKTPIAITNWIYFYLRKRRVILKLNDSTEIVATTNKGLPQGCPLSPILFNVYTNNLHTLTKGDRILFQFADDFTAMVKARTLEIASEKMNEFLNDINTILKQLGLVINSDKCATIIFTNKYHPNTNILINNYPIEVKNCHKFLGVQIDHKLNYKQHIESAVIKAKRKINILKMIAKGKKGAHPSTMLRVAKSIVQPHLDYGLTIIASASKTVFTKLETVQHLYIRTCMRYLKSTPNHVILSESGILPMKERAEYLSIKEIVKNLYHQNTPIVTFLGKFINSNELPSQTSFLEKIAGINNYHLIQLGTKPSYNTTTKLKINTEIKHLKKKEISTVTQKTMVLELIDKNYKNEYLIYTDGSKIDEKTGYGFYDSIERISFSGRLKTQFTIMNAEIFAILKSVEYIISKNIKTAVILTDSKSAALLIKNNTNNDNFLINDLYNKIKTSNVDKIIIQWIPGHTGLIGNERADLAAKMGTSRQQIENTPITKDDLILNIKLETTCMWNQRYKLISEEKGIYHYSIMQNIRLKPWFEDIKLSTRDTITISRLRTGHLATKDRLNRWGLISSDKCEHCNVTEDITHILHKCPKYDTKRCKYQSLIQKEEIVQILKGTNYQKIKEIAKFLGEIGVNI